MARSGGSSQIVSETFSALRNYNYRLWFIGQLISLVGTWMQATAQGYLLYTLTGSSAYLGYVGFIGGVPTWLFTLYGGVVADRISRRLLLLITQVSMMLLAFIMAGLLFSHTIQPWMILVMAFFLGTANAFDAPVRQAFVPELVPPEDMTNSIALNSTLFNTGAVVGPAAAGIAYAAFGAGWCFTLNGISFIAVIIALLMMRLQPFTPPERKSTALEDIKDGFIYVRSNPTMLLFISAIGVIGAFGFSLTTLFPAWSVKILHGDVTTNGLLMSARGLGALIAALMIAAFSARRMRGKLWTIGSFILPVTMGILALVHWLPLTLILLVGVGWGLMTMANNGNALVQSQVSNAYRGRVMSIYTLVFFGVAPLGALLVGTLASKAGEPVAVLFNAVMMAVFAIFIWFRKPELRKMS